MEWYPNTLCFKNRDQVNVRGYWFGGSASFPVISYAACNNKTRNNKCKSPDQIRDFLETNPMYFISQQNNYIGDVFESSPDEQLDSALRDKQDKYMPTQKTWKSIDYGPL